MEGPAMREKNLLVVDEEPGFGELVREIAEEAGYRVSVTQSASAFKRAYETVDPNVVLVDIVMPEIDGIEVIRWLADRRSKAKLIVVSGYNPRYVEMAEDLGKLHGLVEVISMSKPFRVAELRAVLA